MEFDDTRHTWLCGAPKDQCAVSCACDCHTTNPRRMTPLNGWFSGETE